MIAARVVVREALDNVSVHPCDEHNDEIRSQGLSASMLTLHAVLENLESRASNAGGAVVWIREGATDVMHNFRFDKPESGPWVPLYTHPAPAPASKEPAAWVAEPVAWLDDGTLRAGSKATAYRVVTDAQKRGMHATTAASFITPLYTHPAQKEPVADERDEFERGFPIPLECIRCGTGYASTGYNAWSAQEHCQRWKGWQARAALATAQTWQPIETAPKGVAVLVCQAGGPVWHAVYRYVGPRIGKRWESYGLGALPFAPTYWRHIPAAPAKPEGV